MLEILSETKDPTRCQPHLKKCFEGINTLEFDDNYIIHAMNSVEKERVPYKLAIDTNKVSCRYELGMRSILMSRHYILHVVHFPWTCAEISFLVFQARGAVEKWLLEVEGGMFDAIHDVTGRGIVDYANKPRCEWVLEWPGMVVLVVTAIYWTKGDQFKGGRGGAEHASLFHNPQLGNLMPRTL